MGPQQGHSLTQKCRLKDEGFLCGLSVERCGGQLRGGEATLETYTRCTLSTRFSPERSMQVWDGLNLNTP